jgi:hypothetical protein
MCILKEANPNGRALARIVGSNCAVGVDVCLLSRTVLPSVECLSVLRRPWPTRDFTPYKNSPKEPDDNWIFNFKRVRKEVVVTYLDLIPRYFCKEPENYLNQL